MDRAIVECETTSCGCKRGMGTKQVREAGCKQDSNAAKRLPMSDSHRERDGKLLSPPREMRRILRIALHAIGPRSFHSDIDAASGKERLFADDDGEEEGGEDMLVQNGGLGCGNGGKSAVKLALRRARDVCQVYCKVVR